MDIIKQAISCIKLANIGVISPGLHPVVPARKAIDYLNGQWLHWLEYTLDSEKGLKSWRKRGIMPIGENLVAKVISRSALTYYDKAPQRGIWNGKKKAGGSLNVKASELYADMLEEAEAPEKDLQHDRVARLLKCSLMLFVFMPDEKRFQQLLLNASNSFAQYNSMTGVIESLMYTLEAVSAGGNRLYTLYNPDKIYTIEETSEGGKIIDTQDNPYGFVPVAWMWDEVAPDCGLFPSSESYQDLVSFNEFSNVLNTIFGFGARWQALGTPVTNMPLPADYVVGPDSPVKPSGEQMPENPPYFKFESPTVNIGEFLPWYDSFAGRIGETWSVRIERDKEGGSAISALALGIKETWNLKSQARRIKHASAFEKRRYNVISRMATIHGILLPLLSSGAQFYADFEEPSIPSDAVADWTMAKEQMAAGVLSRFDYIKASDPDLTDEEVKAKMAAIDEEKKAASTMPTTPDMKSRLDAALNNNDGIADNNSDKQVA